MTIFLPITTTFSPLAEFPTELDDLEWRSKIETAYNSLSKNSIEMNSFLNEMKNQTVIEDVELFDGTAQNKDAKVLKDGVLYISLEDNNNDVPPSSKWYELANDFSVIFSDVNPTITFNPSSKRVLFVNNVSGELFVCIDDTKDANVWVGQMGTSVSTVIQFDPIGDGSQILQYLFEDNLLDTGGVYDATILGVDRYIYGVENRGIELQDADSIVLPQSFSLLSSPYTISLWIRQAINDTGSIVRMQDVGSNINMIMNADGTINFGQYDANVSLQTVISTTPILLGEWTHVSQTWDGVTIRGYINGAEVGTIACASMRSYDSNALYIGRSESDSTATRLIADIDCFEIFSRAYSSTEIQHIKGRVA